MPEPRTITLDQFLPHPPAKVWRVLTTPELMARWWAPADIKPVIGHSFTIQMPGWGNVACTVLDVEPEARITYTFAEDRRDWVVTWRLVAEGLGTRLFLEHAGFRLEHPAEQAAFRNMSRDWGALVVPALARTLDELTG